MLAIHEKLNERQIIEALSSEQGIIGTRKSNQEQTRFRLKKQFPSLAEPAFYYIEIYLSREGVPDSGKWQLRSRVIFSSPAHAHAILSQLHDF